MKMLDGERGRKKNQQDRDTAYANYDANDMLGTKSLVLFLSSVLQKTDLLEEKLKEKVTEIRERELINKMRDKLDIGDDAAMKFLKSDEFKNINEKGYNFNEKDLKKIEKGIQNKELKVSDILEINKNGTRQEKEVETNTNKNKNTQRNK